MRRWYGKSEVKTQGLTLGLLLKLSDWSAGEVSGIPSVAVKCVDIRRNTSGEGDKGTMKIEEFGKNIAEEVSNMINKW